MFSLLEILLVLIIAAATVTAVTENHYQPQQTHCDIEIKQVYEAIQRARMQAITSGKAVIVAPQIQHGTLRFKGYPKQDKHVVFLANGSTDYQNGRWTYEHGDCHAQIKLSQAGRITLSR